MWHLGNRNHGARFGLSTGLADEMKVGKIQKASIGGSFTLAQLSSDSSGGSVVMGLDAFALQTQFVPYDEELTQVNTSELLTGYGFDVHLGVSW